MKMSTNKPLHETSLTSLKFLHRGKVRDLYEIDAERMLIIQTDRLSAFDVILPTPIPGKGRVSDRDVEFLVPETGARDSEPSSRRGAGVRGRGGRA